MNNKSWDAYTQASNAHSAFYGTLPNMQELLPSGALLSYNKGTPEQMIENQRLCDEANRCLRIVQVEAKRDHAHWLDKL